MYSYWGESNDSCTCDPGRLARAPDVALTHRDLPGHAGRRSARVLRAALFAGHADGWAAQRADCQPRSFRNRAPFGSEGAIHLDSCPGQSRAWSIYPGAAGQLSERRTAIFDSTATAPCLFFQTWRSASACWRFDVGERCPCEAGARASSARKQRRDRDGDDARFGCRHPRAHWNNFYHHAWVPWLAEPYRNHIDAAAGGNLSAPGWRSVLAWCDVRARHPGGIYAVSGADVE